MTPTAKRLRTGLVSLVASALIIAAGYWLVANRQNLIDWWILRTYKPPSDIVALANATTMTNHGRDLLYVSEPEIENSQAFNLHCRDVGEEGSVLGCYTPTLRIYLYNVTDKRLPHVKDVTAAHEMLHAAYERLDAAMRKRIDAMVLTAANKLQGDEALQATIKLYRKTEPGQLMNELHSIIGTEYGNLQPDLEDYYKQYFTDRSKVVAFAQGYKSVLEASRARLAQEDAQLAVLKQQIMSEEAQLTVKRAELDSQSQRLQSLRHSDPDEYNREVPVYNAKVRSFNALATHYNTLVKRYNELVATRNREAAAQNDLYHSLDSKYQPVSTN